jgi:hypothetical protein
MRTEVEKMFNRFFLQFHRKWLKWAIAFHVVEFLQKSAHSMDYPAAVLYSVSRKQGRDQDVKTSKNQ